MQLRTPSAFALYVGSYLPLGLVLFVQDVDPVAVRRGFCPPSAWFGEGCVVPLMHPWWAVGTVAIGIACLILTTLTLRAIGTPRQVKVAEAKHIPADLINYAMPYIVSFMGLDFGSPTRLLGFGVFFVWIFWITYRSGQIVMNPILIVFGWRLYEIKYSFMGIDKPWLGRALFRGEVEPDKVYRKGSLQDVMILRELQQGETDG
ncbi:hypothetical protein [Sphingomonas sp. NPDC079357]|uniref:hypothetical protein n=1 Tax=Sphingomonas sp. NPDC079357 TaxID=3364518 RepID=UPI0038512EF3